MDNRRRAPRYEVALAAELYDGGLRFSAQAKNLSLSGVGLKLRQPLVERRTVLMSLFLVEDGIEDASVTPLELQGQVMWVAPVDLGGYEAGVRFAPLQAHQQTLLSVFLSRLPDAHDA